MPQHESTMAGKILSIEDDPAVRESVTAYLEDHGFTVEQAVNGEEGIERFRSCAPDLVLVDLRMPRVDGFEVLRTVRAESPDTPVIVVSGTGNIAEVVEALHVGAWDFLLKPLEDMTLLQHAVTANLERSRLLKQNRRHQIHLEEEVARRTAELQNSNTELARQIADREKAQRDLQQSEQMLESIINCVPDVIYRLDAEGQITFVSRAAQNYGYEPRELIGRSIFDIIHPDDREKAMYRINERRRGDRRTRSLQLRFLTKGGTEVSFEMAGRANFEYPVFMVDAEGLRQSDGLYVGTQGIARDITERLALENQLRVAQKMEAIGTLAGGISHDFNNILSGIIGYTYLAVNIAEELHRDDLLQYLGEVGNAGQRAAGLVRQILAFSRQGEQSKIPVKAQSLVKEALKLLRGSLPSTIAMEEHIDSSCGAIYADPTQIHQVIMNLCTNAYHAMRPQGGVLKVCLEQVNLSEASPNWATMVRQFPELHAGNHARLRVEDTGTGMASEVLEKIFDPYFTTKPKGEGTGLGLATVHGIITDHGGAISVASVPGRGTSFDIFMPLCERDPVQADPSDMSLDPYKGTERVLFIDDEPTLAVLVKRMLEPLGYSVEAFSVPGDALARFEEADSSFGVVITDLTMPGMTGLQVAETIARIRPSVPVLLSTGGEQALGLHDLRQQGVSDIIYKPVTAVALAAAVRKALDDA